MPILSARTPFRHHLSDRLIIEGGCRSPLTAYSCERRRPRGCRTFRPGLSCLMAEVRRPRLVAGRAFATA
jgi:hypothetical protein